ncbi:MAG TPA: superoxide dismutase [Cu-Zn] SodC [Alphaproteobacteria bacterium]|nr:superoxide dismutase [Cu-Zn] SodC [Alphaproteobacteria bacterium]
MRSLIHLCSGLALLAAGGAAAQTAATVNAISAEGVGAALGTVTFADSPQGLVVTPALKGLPPGERGFHIHENADCGPRERDGKMTAGLAAGGHYDPAGTKLHKGPQGGGHLGDMPTLKVAADGSATAPVTVPNLKLADLKGRAVMIHAGGDTYSDQPEPLGGGGARIACGIIR